MARNFEGNAKFSSVTLKTFWFEMEWKFFEAKRKGKDATFNPRVVEAELCMIFGVENYIVQKQKRRFKDLFLAKNVTIQLRPYM